MNWGKGITIVMLSFMAFIGSMVYYAFTKNADLVRDDYYENELAFDQTKSERSNYTKLDADVHIEKNERGITFMFPEIVSEKNVGFIEFYRPDQKKYDRKFDLAVNAERMQSLDYSNFVDGYYDVSVHWTDEDDKSYIFESNIEF